MEINRPGDDGLAPPHEAEVPDEVLEQLDDIYAALQDGSLDTGVDRLTGAKLEPEAPSVSGSG